MYFDDVYDVKQLIKIENYGWVYTAILKKVAPVIHDE